jgi:hypothetical protein
LNAWALKTHRFDPTIIEIVEVARLAAQRLDASIAFQRGPPRERSGLMPAAR